MFAYLEILRLDVCVLAVLGLLVGAIVSNAITFPSTFLASIATFLICGGGNVINDYFDYKIDKINKPRRPIPSGRISRKNAGIYFLFLSLVGLLSASMVSTEFLVIATLCVLVGFGYSWKLKKIPLVGNVAVGFLSSTPYLAAGLIVGSFYNLFFSPILILALISFFGVVSREIFKSIEDVNADKLAGAKTLLTITVGKRMAMKLAKIFLLVGVLLLPMPYYLGMLGEWYLASIIPAILVCVCVLFQKEAKRAQRALKFAMYLVTLAFLIGALTR